VKTFVICVLFALLSPAFAADTPVEFDDPAKRERYETLLEELRCLVCQNQSLADSHADLAQDLRNEVYSMVVAGEDKQAVTDFMIARYGDFVLYKPPMKLTTLLLWFGPALLLVGAVIIVRRTTRARRTGATPLTAEQRAQARALLETNSDQT
jgi:cytochrome c-type biogenesis protein CcmH|tara:strand:+ start:80 stop:538 length:459 start_codon:yes stop_codon:yes gene_type:complete